LRRAVAPPVMEATKRSLCGSVAATEASTLPKKLPTPVIVSPMVRPGGDEILGGGKRLQRRAPRRIDHRAGAVDLLQRRGRGHLARTDAHQVEAFDRESTPSGVDVEHVLEIVETDLIGDRVIGTAEQIGREHLRRAKARRLFIGAGDCMRADERKGGR